MVYGHEAPQPHLQWVEQTLQYGPDALDTYVHDVATRLAFAWDYAALQKPIATEKFNRAPIKHRTFTEYKPGDLFFLKHIPDATVTHWTSPKDKRPISSKLQQRWVGPYKIIAQINTVLYTAEINGVVKRVHAISMKPLKSSFVQYTREFEPTPDLVQDQGYVPFMDAGGFQNALNKERE
jgi:hypothetical protein